MQGWAPNYKLNLIHLPSYNPVVESSLTIINSNHNWSLCLNLCLTTEDVCNVLDVNQCSRRVKQA